MNIVIQDCNKEIIELLLKNGVNPECEDRSTNTTALLMAVIRGNLLTTQLLVNHGANPRALSKVKFNEKTSSSNNFCFSRLENSTRVSFINKSNGKNKRVFLPKKIIIENLI